MKKLLTLLFVTLIASSAFADITLSKLTYEDGSASNKIFNLGDEFKIAIEYTSDVDTTVYLWVQSKNVASGSNWSENKFWFVDSFNIVAGTALTDTVTVIVPSEVTDDNLLQIDVFRIGVSTATSYWSKRIKDSAGDNVLVFGNVEDVPVVGSNLAISTLTHADGKTSKITAVEGTDVKVKIAYTDAYEGEKVYINVSSKDDWSTTWASVEVTLAAGDGVDSATFNVRAFSDTADTEVSRIIVCKSADDIWGAQYDVNGDKTDAIYFDITEYIEPAVPSAIAFTNLTWADGSKTEKNIVEGALDSVIINYNNAEANDSVCVVITAKYLGDAGTWTSNILKQQVACPVGQDSLIFTYNVHDFNTTTTDSVVTDDPNKYRIFLTDGGTSWGDKLTLEDNSNNGLYGVVKEDVPGFVSMPEQMSLSLYPNPTSGMVQLTLEKAATLAVHDLSGKSVCSVPCNSGSNSINLSACDAGLYIVTVSNVDGVQSLKLQVK